MKDIIIRGSKFFVISIVLLLAYTGKAQTVVNFNFTGGVQSWTVPSCVTSITVTMQGASGASIGSAVGGTGAELTFTVPVSPGDVIGMVLGGQGGPATGGYNGGGCAWLSVPANAGWDAGGGGGSTDLSINGTTIAIAAGGGGAGGGSVSNNFGGNGGCVTGSNGGNTYGAGGGGGSQSAGGNYGAPWAGTPGTPAGGPGSQGQGGCGGMWQTASGGGGGGGYYGGGGGGNDGCCTGANGGGGGGGGSSLVPAGGGCTTGSNSGDGTVSISYVGGLTATAANTGAYCEGETIQLNATGGVNYSWVGPNGFASNLQNPTIPACTVVNGGSYTVTVTDPACPLTDSATTIVVVKPMPDVDPIMDQIICNGSNTVAVNFTGSVPGTVYNWTNDNTATSLAAAGAGNIAAFTGTAVVGTEVSNVVVTPSLNGCVGTPEAFSITVLLDPSLTVSNDTLICENGTAYLSASGSGGGGGPYIYYWSQTPDNSASQIENPLVPTTYTVYVESASGCFSAPMDIEVTMYPPLSGTITPWDTICPTYFTDITATASGGMGQPYSFTWSSGQVQNSAATSHTINVSPAATQNYIVTIEDGCESTPLVLQTNIRVSPLPVPQYLVLNPIQCEPAVFDIVNTTDPTMSQYVYWLIDGEFPYVNQDTITTTSFWAGSYDIQMIVTSFEGCVDSTTFSNALTVKPEPIANFHWSPNPVQMFNTDVTFVNYTVGADTYQWFIEQGSPSTSTSLNVQSQFPDGVTGNYEVMLIATSNLGCIDTMIQIVRVLPEVIIYAPNTFTPDGDEFNQDWRIYMEGIDVYDFELLIFNRWGETVWESHDISIPWDGTYAGKVLPIGTYTWVVRTKDLLNDGKYTYNGHVNIVK